MTEQAADGQRIDQIKKNDGAAKGATEGVGFMGISIMGFGCCVILAFVSLSFCSFFASSSSSSLTTSFLFDHLLVLIPLFSSFVSSLLLGSPTLFLRFYFTSYHS